MENKLIKNLASVGMIQVANYVFPMISIPIISRIIGPDRLGVINFTASFIAYFTLMIGFGFDLTATRKVASDPHNEEKRNMVFSEVFSSKCLLLAISILIFTVCVVYIPQLALERELAIYTFLICFSTVMTQNWLFQAMQDLTKMAVLNLSSKVVFTVMVLLLIRTKDDYTWQPLALSLSQILMAAASFCWAIKRYKLKWYRTKLSRCLELLWEEKTFFFSLCIMNLYTNTNIIILGLVQNPTDVGYYTAGQKMISIIQIILTVPLAQVLFPYMSKAFADDFDKGLDIAQRLLPVVFVFTFISGIGVIIFAPYLIGFFYGSAFSPAIEVCRVLAFIPMIIAMATILGIHVMLNLKMDKVFFKVVCFGALFSIIANLFLVTKLGYLGAAYTWTLTELFILAAFFLMLREKGIFIINLKYFRFDYNLSLIKTYIGKVNRS
jgi:O-antigen/teichoic acid export membrane protein